MIAAFSASRLVCPAISSMTRTISPISCDRSASSARALFASSTAILNLAHALDGAADGLAPFVRGVLHVARELRRVRRGLPISSVVAFISTIELAVWMANDEKLSVFVATSLIDAIISSMADAVCSTNSASVSAMRPTSSMLRRHLQDRSRRLFGVRGELLHARAHVVDGLVDLSD